MNYKIELTDDVERHCQQDEEKMVIYIHRSMPIIDLCIYVHRHIRGRLTMKGDVLWTQS